MIFAFFKFHSRLTQWLLLFLLVVTALVAFPELALAQEKTDGIPSDIIAKANTVISFLSALLWPMLLLIGALLDNELIFGAGAEERLLTIWVQFRDFANILFVIVLIVAAFMNIFSVIEAEEKWQIQKLLPKFIIGLILINFSFVGAKVVLDVSNVVTSAVFALPDSVLQQQQQFDKKKRAEEICAQVKRTGVLPATAKPWDAWAARFCSVKTSGQAILMESLLTNFNTRNAPFAFAINMGKLHIMDIKKETVVFIKDFVLNSLFSLAMFVIYAVSFIILALVLLERLVVLWVVVAFSPLIVAGYFLKDYLGSVGGQADTVKTKVQTVVTAPIIIGLSMSIGYIMLDVFNSREDFYFDLPLGDTSTQITGTEDLRQFLIGITAAFVVWTGAKYATKENLFLGGIIGGITEKVGTLGRAIGSIPFKYIPAVPIPTVGGGTQSVTLSQLADIPQRLIDNVNQSYRNKFDSLFGQSISPNVDAQLKKAQAANGPEAQKILASLLYKGENLNKVVLTKISEIAKTKLGSTAYDQQTLKQIQAAANSGSISATNGQALATRLYADVAKVQPGAVPTTDTQKIQANDANFAAIKAKNWAGLSKELQDYIAKNTSNSIKDAATFTAALSDSDKHGKAQKAQNFTQLVAALK